MAAPFLPDDEVALLPRQRRTYLRLLAGTLLVVVTLVGYAGAGEWVSRADGLHVRRLGLSTSDGTGVFVAVLYGLLFLPLLRRFSYRRRDLLFFLLCPIWVFVIAGKAGYRLTALPYRDWPPRPDEYASCVQIRGTASYVLRDPSYVEGLRRDQSAEGDRQEAPS